MPAKPTPAFSLWPLIATDVIAVAGIVALHTSLGKEVSPAIHIAEALTIGGVGAACAYFWWHTVNKQADREAALLARGITPASVTGGDTDALRKEIAENMGVLQNDLNSLGAAVLKRLAANAKPESEHFEAIAGTVTDLAISLAEARETLAGIAADIAETKSVSFEMQAQIDQQADALRAFEHSVTGIRSANTIDAGEGAAPGSLGKALLAGASGAAVARLIGNGNSRRETVAGTVTDVAPLASSDIEGAYDSGDEIIPSQDFAIDTDTMEAEWEAPGEDYPELREPLPDTFARQVAPENREEETESRETQPLFDDGVNEDDYVDSTTPSGNDSHGDLLSLAAGVETRRKPRRPAKTDTAIIAHVMIGIGNKPFLRGIGPGLSTEKGVPMEYVDVGRWQWISPEPGTTVTVSLWKNDEEPADGDLVEVPAGMTLEIHPQFSH
jgi:hypothetical protein